MCGFSAWLSRYCRTDSWQLRNVAADRSSAKVLAELRGLLDEWMGTTGDPRATTDDDRWDRYPYN
ncbi:MAG: hypothetical protein GEU99_23215 [Luteitalea sp.]|nr:hypothetical protein [Luteitalea sp.]